MRWTSILTFLRRALCAAPLLAGSAPALAQAPGDGVILDMREAFRRADKPRLAALLPQARGHALEPWAAYWELKARLEEAQPSEVDAFLQRWAGTYQEDRLRNDWLLLAGQRRDWDSFNRQQPLYRMQDDREVRCYALAVQHITQPGADVAAEVRRNWYAQRDLDDGCLFAASRLVDGRQLSAVDLWRKARMAMHANRPTLARAVIALEAPEVAPQINAIQSNAARWLATQGNTASFRGRELVTLALVKLASQDPAVAAPQFERFSALLTAEERDWVLGTLGMRAALRLQDDALGYYRRVQNPGQIDDEALDWMARAALRASDWSLVLRAIDAMREGSASDNTWVYWRARALAATSGSAAGGQTAVRQQEAQRLYQSIARAGGGFYEKLAMEELGQRVTVPPRPEPLTPAEREAARLNPALNRALYAVAIGLRSEGVREWNYAVNLHQRGGMSDRERYAAADFACQRQVWDRCINTSERTQAFADFDQRFPTPYREAVVRQAESIGLDPAYVYGLIRQESRFVTDARSHVGASGLMQVMPATARWTARKIGLTDFQPHQINDRDTNILIGTSYLKLALDDFQGSMPMAAAAYNAGPGRPRAWRNGPVLEAAIWAENIPFNETRTYVKNVLSNKADYAALLTGEPQSLKARLGTVGPLESGQLDASRDLP